MKTQRLYLTSDGIVSNKIGKSKNKSKIKKDPIVTVQKNSSTIMLDSDVKQEESVTIAIPQVEIEETTVAKQKEDNFLEDISIKKFKKLKQKFNKEAEGSSKESS